MKSKNSVWIAVIGLLIISISAVVVYKLGDTNVNRKVVIHELAPLVVNDISGTMTVRVLAYCPCVKCNTVKWEGMVATGHAMISFTERGVNICAADPDYIPLGVTIKYDDKEYLVIDVGKDIKGKTINILLPTHKEAQDFGVKEDQVIEIVGKRNTNDKSNE